MIGTIAVAFLAGMASCLPAEPGIVALLPEGGILAIDLETVSASMRALFGMVPYFLAMHG